MSSPNPLIPQGSLLEQQAKSKSTFHVAALIVGLHVFLLGGLLIIGCKREEPKLTEAPPVTDPFAPAPLVTETNLTDPALLSAPATNLTTLVPTNPPVPPVSYEPPITSLAQPPVQPVPEAGPVQPGVEYEVKKGEIAGRIASRNKLSLKQLQEANPGVDLSKLRVGQKINLPVSTAAPVTPAIPAAGDAGTDVISYTVKGGDTLTKLAKKHGTTIRAIREASGLKSNDLKVGQKLRIPAKAAPASASVPEPVAPPSTQPIPAAFPTAAPVATPVATPLPR